MTDAMTTQARLEAELERVALERDEVRQALREMGRENAKLRAALNLHREALADHRRELLRLSRVEAAGRALVQTFSRRLDPKVALSISVPSDRFDALLSALSEEEGTPAMDIGWAGAPALFREGYISGVEAAAKCLEDGMSPTGWLLSRKIRALSPSTATPSEAKDRCTACEGTGLIEACPYCGGSGRATPRGDR